MLEAINVHKYYKQSEHTLHVLKGINLKVREGDILTIVGPSGAGKSTLLHTLGGLDRPSEGSVLLDDQDIYQLNDRQLAKVRNLSAGFIFQFYHLLPEFTALENVMVPAMIKGGEENDEAVKGRAQALLERVGLKDRVSHKPNELSGGEQQRVAIARALINQPKIIFCDEPTGNLDSETGRGIVNILIELNQTNKQTLIIVTHDESLAEVSGKVIRLRDGEMVDGSRKVGEHENISKR
jgi:lipoprotein-releasing system ATP-binding protein